MRVKVDRDLITSTFIKRHFVFLIGCIQLKGSIGGKKL